MKEKNLDLTLHKVGLQLKTIIVHKHKVFKAMAKAGYPIKGLLHDMSKFSPTEFFELARGQGYGYSPVDVNKEVKGYCEAWQHHKGHNPHHWEHWVDRLSDGGVGVKIPFRYMAEMFCDYMGAGQTYQGKDWTPQSAYKYWETLRVKSIFHPESLSLMDGWFEDLITNGLNWTLKHLKESEGCYNGKR